MADERLCNPISTQELERRWAAVRAAMPEQKFDALIVQGANNMCGTGGYFRWFTGVSMATSYPATVIFPKDALMTLVSHGPIGGERDLNGNDPVWRGVGRALSTASFPAIDYCIPYDPELVAREIKKAGYRNVGIVGWNNMLFGFGDRLRALLDGVTLTDATRLVDPIKAKKSAEEIELIRMAGQMQDEILAKVQGQIKSGKRDFELFAYGAYVGNLLGSETGYMLGSSSAARRSRANIRPRREQSRQMRDGDVLYYQCENTGPGGMMTHVGRYYVLGKAPQELVDAFGIICEAQDNTVRMLQPGASPKEIFAEHNAFMQKHGMHKEPRLHCHGQGYDVVERPMIRHDEDMPLAAAMNIGLHPTFGNAETVRHLLRQLSDRSERQDRASAPARHARFSSCSHGRDQSRRHRHRRRHRRPRHRQPRGAARQACGRAGERHRGQIPLQLALRLRHDPYQLQRPGSQRRLADGEDRSRDRRHARKDLARAVTKDGRRLTQWLRSENIDVVRLDGYQTNVLAPAWRKGFGLTWKDYGSDIALQRLGANFEKRQGRILRGHRATGLKPDKGGIVVETSQGPMVAKAVVIADGGFQANLDMVREFGISPAPEKLLPAQRRHRDGRRHQARAIARRRHHRPRHEQHLRPHPQPRRHEHDEAVAAALHGRGRRRPASWSTPRASASPTKASAASG